MRVLTRVTGHSAVAATARDSPPTRNASVAVSLPPTGAAMPLRRQLPVRRAAAETRMHGSEAVLSHHLWIRARASGLALSKRTSCRQLSLCAPGRRASMADFRASRAVKCSAAPRLSRQTVGPVPRHMPLEPQNLCVFRYVAPEKQSQDCLLVTSAACDNSAGPAASRMHPSFDASRFCAPRAAFLQQHAQRAD